MKKYVIGFAFGVAVLAFFVARGERVAPLAAQEAGDGLAPFTFRIVFGARGGAAADWDGAVAVENGRVELVTGWHLAERDAAGLGGWKVRTEREPVGVNVYGSGSDATRARVTTARGGFDFTIGELRSAGRLAKLDGGAEVRWLLQSSKLTADLNEDDFPSVAEAADGTVWAAWASFSGRQDEIRVRRYSRGRWGTFTEVPGVEGDVWKPQVALDGRSRPWVVWAEQIGGNWDLYARALEGDRWGARVRLTDDPGSDIYHHLASDAAGELHVVWQGYRRGDFNIYLRTLRGDRWEAAAPITETAGNDWEPAVASDGRGRIAVVWDSYRNGDYDVFARVFENGRWGDERTVSATPSFEAHATTAIDSAGRVWIGWEQGGAGWGKDQGYMIRDQRAGTQLGGERSIHVRCYAGGALRQPAAAPAEALPQAEREFLQWPKLAADRDGRVWLHFRRRVQKAAPGQGAQGTRSVWQGYLTRYEGDRWAQAWELPDSHGRISNQSSMAAGAAGNIWVAWPTDNRRWWGNSHIPVVNQVYAGFVRAAGPVAEPKLAAPAAPAAPQTSAGHRDERGDLAAIRSYRARVGGSDLRIVRGDLHRHTELSWDGGGTGDSSVLDFYRYMIDVASMDFGAVTDHQGGGDHLYSYWLIEKTTDMFFLPDRYLSLYGYERSAIYPNGHRNVVHTRRGIPVVSFFTQTSLQGERPGVGTGALLENDTKLLYEILRRTGGIAISHTSATRMGTDWRDNDPEIEPVVEIYQGARSSYEYAGAPRSAAAERDKQLNDRAGYQPLGFVDLAWKKGYRLGTITSSDHGSTHISYALVYARDFTREGVLDGLRKRHTYGATDNIVLDFRINDRFMGEELELRGLPKLKIKVRGTAPVARIEVRRDDETLTAFQPDRAEFEVTYEDAKAAAGAHRYYVRVEQADGQLAWSSPIWVRVK